MVETDSNVVVMLVRGVYVYCLMMTCADINGRIRIYS